MRIHDSRLHATLLTAIGLLSCAEAVAAIPRNYEIVSQSGTGTQRPTCPGSKKVLGGGATVPSFGFFHESRPETDGTGWRATAQDNVFLYAYAICADVDSSYEITSASGGGAQHPTCTGSKKVTGGGAYVPSFRFLHDDRPETDGSGWQANAQDNVFVVAYAICADVDSSWELTSQSGGGAQDRPCSGSKKVLGGGASVPSFQFLHESRPETDGSGWRANATGNAFLYAYAICSDTGTGSGGSDGLVVGKRANGDLDLSWSPSCVTDDDDYAIYSGTIGGTFSDHAPVACSTGGSTSDVVTPPSGSAYYLVVPLRTGIREGSYGSRTSGERPPSTQQCLPQVLAPCS